MLFLALAACSDQTGTSVQARSRAKSATGQGDPVIETKCAPAKEAAIRVGAEQPSTNVSLERGEVSSVAVVAAYFGRDPSDPAVTKYNPSDEVVVCVFRGDFGPPRGPPRTVELPNYDALRVFILPDGFVWVEGYGYLDGAVNGLPSDSSPPPASTPSEQPPQS